MNLTLLKSDFRIITPAYEGPLGLLLDLIEAHKLLVNELALASITDEFVKHVKTQERFPSMKRLISYRSPRPCSSSNRAP